MTKDAMKDARAPEANAETTNLPVFPGDSDGDPSDAKLELRRGIPHRLGGAPRACGVTGGSELSKACELVDPVCACAGNGVPGRCAPSRVVPWKVEG